LIYTYFANGQFEGIRCTTGSGGVAHSFVCIAKKNEVKNSTDDQSPNGAKNELVCVEVA